MNDNNNHDQKIFYYSNRNDYNIYTKFVAYFSLHVENLRFEMNIIHIY